MKKVSLTFTLAIFLLQPLFVSAEETCEEFTAPVISVADFDANGIVNRKDIRMLRKYMHHVRIHKRLEKLRNRGSERANSRRFRRHLDHEAPAYSPMFDRNADGEIDIIDMFMTTRDRRKNSTQADQKLVTDYNNYLEGSYTCAGTTEVIPESEEGRLVEY